MWKIYSSDYMKHNRASGLSITAASFICAAFLSLLLCLFFQLWLYDVRQIVLEEGDYQARLTGEFDQEDIAVIDSFAHVEHVVSNIDEGHETVSIYFTSMKYVYDTMPLIAEKLGAAPESIQYHDSLLAMYFLPGPQGIQSSPVLFLYLAVLCMMVVSLVLIIRNAFFTFMNSRIHQLGILMSVGASPGQILTCLLQEAAILCSLPILLGSVLGTGLCALLISVFEHIARNALPDRIPMAFCFHPSVWLTAILLSALTVLLSAWYPAFRMSRVTVLDAIRTGADVSLSARHLGSRRRFLSFGSVFRKTHIRLFGPLGELAAGSLRARRKALRTTTLSLTMAFLAFTIFLCFMTISSASVKRSYFERYKDAWDIMVTIKGTILNAIDESEAIRDLDNVESLAVYQKAEAYTFWNKEQLSGELLALGGLPALTGQEYPEAACPVRTTLVVMDDTAFAEYCRQINFTHAVNNGAILLNIIWDSKNSEFNRRTYIPFIKEGEGSLTLKTESGEMLLELPVAGYTDTEPRLREEYEDYALVCILPLSLLNSLCESGQNRLAGQPSAEERLFLPKSDTFLRVLVSDDAKIQETADSIRAMLDGRFSFHLEDRISEEISNRKIWNGYWIVVSSICALLAIIGIANIFSDTLGFIRQRRREFARYLSVGMTPGEMRRLLEIEVLSIAGRPLLVTLPLSTLFVASALRQSRVTFTDFITHLPLLPILAFLLLIFLAVGLAYYMGARNIFRCDLSEVLKDDTFI